MSDDLLARATRALRESSDGPALQVGATRARLLASAEARYSARRRPFLRVALVFGGLLLTGTAMAAHRVGGFGELLRAVAPAAWIRGSVAPQHPHRKQSVSPRPPDAAVPSSATAAALPPVDPPVLAAVPEAASDSAGTRETGSSGSNAKAPSRAVAPSSIARSDRRGRAWSGSPRRSPRAMNTPPAGTDSEVQAPSAPETSSESKENAAAAPASQPAPLEPSAAARALTLFRRADQLQRQHSDAALAAWDAYLRVAPTGTLAPEARYNRALCLVRARAFAAARQALEPFASGREGGYRKDDARALLESLPR